MVKVSAPVNGAANKAKLSIRLHEWFNKKAEGTVSTVSLAVGWANNYARGGEVAANNFVADQLNVRLNKNRTNQP